MLRTIISLVLLLAAGAFAADIAGEYTGTWTSDSGSSDGKLHVSVSKTADSWDCKLAYSGGGGDAEVTPKQLSCTVDGAKLRGKYDSESDGGKQHITIEAALNGNSLEGTYAVAGEDGQALDSGKWKASAAH